MIQLPIYLIQNHFASIAPRNQVLSPNIVASKIMVEWKETITNFDVVITSHIYYGDLWSEFCLDRGFIVNYSLLQQYA
jgi:hypothetical protein